jgi:hypothetical protein
LTTVISGMMALNATTTNTGSTKTMPCCLPIFPWDSSPIPYLHPLSDQPFVGKQFGPFLWRKLQPGPDFPERVLPRAAGRSTV